ncbi:unnamed protein product [Diabrotica balteata]|uniref:THAP-type domain-containing protein n=1 Tax=Diabrotica balteata TaxID=107213 RepID=A0A9N9TAE4_DIABA|nr:unnamed protein product [Diabrotica balteata]
MDDLLNHVVVLSREFAVFPSVKGKSQANSHQEGIAIRKNALINIFDDTSTIDVNEEIIESDGQKILRSQDQVGHRMLKIHQRKKMSILKWKKIVQCEKLAIYSAQYCYYHFRICSLHFKEPAFAGMLKSRLKKDAKPSIHLVRLNIPVQGTPVEKLQTFASTPESLTYRIQGTLAVEELQAVASTSAESMMYSIEDAENVGECVFSPTTPNISSDISRDRSQIKRIFYVKTIKDCLKTTDKKFTKKNL